MTACSLQEPQPITISETKELEFTATNGEPQTKTILIQDGLLQDGQPKMITWWSPQEEICIFYGNSEGNKFTSTNTERVLKATFRGSINAFTGQTETGDFNYFWAVYPYSAAVSCDGESVVATLANEQEALAGSYANNTNITIAKSSGLSLGFYNVCSFLRFYVEKEGVISATFRGNNNEDVAGTFNVSFGNNGKPTAPVVTNGVKEIVLKRPNNEPFEVGTSYYFVILPQTFESGFTVQFDTETETGNRIITARATFARNSINYGNTAFDHNVTYEGTIPPNNEIWYTSVSGEVINPNTNSNYTNGFNASSIVSNTVTDGIGKIVFSYDLTSIPSQAFYRTNFKTIRLPESVTAIADKVFYECYYLEQVDMPQVRTISDYNFYKCTSLKSITLPSTLTHLGVNCFYQCDDLEEATINTSANLHTNGLAYLFNGKTLKTLKGPWATQDGKYVIIDNKLVMAAGNGLESAIIPSGVTEICPQVFYRYSSLSHVKIPSTVSTIGFGAFYYCQNLDYIEIEATSVPNCTNSFDNTNDCPIIVPSASVSSYKTSWPAYSLRIGASLDDIPKNLSKNERANCYIVNSSGQFRFNASTLGNSNNAINYITQGSPNTVEVLWESTLIPSSNAFTYSNNSGTLISDIRYENEQVVFTSLGNEGNALVAVKNASGQIMWSWHLWFVVEDINEITTSSGMILMDRNLGATKSISGYLFAEQFPNYGLLYQRGRKDPFVGGDSALWSHDNNTANYQASVQNPMTLYGTSSSESWSSSTNEWYYPTKDRNDPCPPGWKIPASSCFSDNWYYMDDEGKQYPASNANHAYSIDDYYYDGVLFPCAGYIGGRQINNNYSFYYFQYSSWDSDDDGGYKGYGYYSTTDGYYEFNNGYNDSFHFSFNSNSIYNGKNAFSIRCCKDCE